MRNKVRQDTDRFGNLPPEVLQAILSRLTIKDAVRTSVLSSSWRYTWTAIPHLTFTRSTVPSASCHPDSHHLRCVSIVDRVLLHHQRPIRKFHLIDFVKFCPDLDRWILFLSKHGIENLILVSWVGPPKLSFHLFSCQRLQYLALRGFVIEPPPTITPLANLKILALSRVSVSDVSLKRLLLACQFLEKLRLESFHGLCQKLKEISLCGSFQGRLLDTPLLVPLRIDMDPLIEHGDEEDKEQTGESGVCNLIKVLGGLRRIQKLKIGEHFLSVSTTTFWLHFGILI